MLDQKVMQLVETNDLKKEHVLDVDLDQLWYVAETKPYLMLYSFMENPNTDDDLIRYMFEHNNPDPEIFITHDRISKQLRYEFLSKRPGILQDSTVQSFLNEKPKAVDLEKLANSGIMEVFGLDPAIIDFSKIYEESAIVAGFFWREENYSNSYQYQTDLALYSHVLENLIILAEDFGKVSEVQDLIQRRVYRHEVLDHISKEALKQVLDWGLVECLPLFDNIAEFITDNYSPNSSVFSSFFIAHSDNPFATPLTEEVIKKIFPELKKCRALDAEYFATYLQYEIHDAKLLREIYLEARPYVQSCIIDNTGLRFHNLFTSKVLPKEFIKDLELASSNRSYLPLAGRKEIPFRLALKLFKGIVGGEGALASAPDAPKGFAIDVAKESSLHDVVYWPSEVNKEVLDVIFDRVIKAGVYYEAMGKFHNLSDEQVAILLKNPQSLYTLMHNHGISLKAHNMVVKAFKKDKLDEANKYVLKNNIPDTELEEDVYYTLDKEILYKIKSYMELNDLTTLNLKRVYDPKHSLYNLFGQYPEEKQRFLKTFEFEISELDRVLKNVSKKDKYDLSFDIYTEKHQKHLDQYQFVIQLNFKSSYLEDIFRIKGEDFKEFYERLGKLSYRSGHPVLPMPGKTYGWARVFSLEKDKWLVNEIQTDWRNLIKVCNQLASMEPGQDFQGVGLSRDIVDYFQTAEQREWGKFIGETMLENFEELIMSSILSIARRNRIHHIYMLTDKNQPARGSLSTSVLKELYGRVPKEFKFHKVKEDLGAGMQEYWYRTANNAKNI